MKRLLLGVAILAALAVLIGRLRRQDPATKLHEEQGESREHQVG
jgi:hypothetical protein